jgi:cysteine desulfurase
MRAAENDRLTSLRDGLLSGLMRIPGVARTGHPQLRLPNSASVVIDGVEGGDLVAALDLEEIEASTGSACTTGSVEPSHVLLAMGIEPERARGSLRLTLGRENTAADVERTIDAVTSSVARLRATSPAPEPAEEPAAMGAPSV